MKLMRVSLRPFLTALALVVVIGGCSGGAHPLEGRPAPAFELRDAGGQTVRLSDLAGQVVVFEFWAPWCGHCRDNVPAMKRIHEELARDGVSVIGVSLEKGQRTVGEFTAAHGMEYRILFAERRMLDDYQVTAIPVTVVVDAKGVIRRWHAGAVSYEEVRKWIEECKSL